MPDQNAAFEVYEHPVLSPHARRLAVVLTAVAALVLGLVAPTGAAGDGPAGRITGTVTGAGTGPLDEAQVLAFQLVDGDVEVGAWAETDAQGHYTLTLPAGSYLVDFWEADHVEEFFDDAQSFEDATPVLVSADGTATADAELAPYATIAGHVTKAAGDPAGAVRAYDAAGRVSGWGYVEADGSYEVSGLAAGSYRLAFNRLSGFAFSAPQFYDDRAESAGLTAADPVTLTAGQHRTGVDATLVEGGHLTGTLQDTDGHPLRCRVQAYTADGSLVTRNGRSAAATGAFDITGLSSGSYRVRVVRSGDCGNGVQYVDADGGALATRAGDAVPFGATLGGHAAVTDAALVYDLGPAPVNAVPPAVLGVPEVGQWLSATGGSWSPGARPRLTYEWLRAGVPIPGATRRDRRVERADIGSALSVRVTAHRGARTGTAVSAPTAPVRPAGGPVDGGGDPVPEALRNVRPPQVTGVAAVDATLTVDPGDWAPAATSFTYVWRSWSQVLQVTQSNTYVVPDSMFKQPLSVTVVASRPGTASAEVVVPVSPKVQGGTWPAIAPPRLSGPPRVGAVLRARPARVTPRPRTLRLTWFRDGKAIAEGRGRSYRLRGADVGHRIWVSVQYGRLHYDKATVTSAKSKRIRR